MFKWMGITWQAMSGEGASADTDSAQKWHKNVTPITAQYSPKDTANKDETA
jgi:hypothetical protein